MDGLLIIDKPIGPTSHDVVQIVKRELDAKKVGHLGTLDPPASGVLPLVIDGATKYANRLSGGDKVYTFTLVLGVTTDTDDDSGAVKTQREIAAGCIEKLGKAIERFIGKIDQVPPAYSARKSNGVRMYKLARKGVEADVEPRRVDIYELEIKSVHDARVDMLMRCSSGTYVRALCRDIGELLGCGGHASAIRRIQSGRFTIDRAITLDRIKFDWRDAFIDLNELI